MKLEQVKQVLDYLGIYYNYERNQLEISPTYCNKKYIVEKDFVIRQEDTEIIEKIREKRQEIKDLQQQLKNNKKNYQK